jgi:hypothetical protein
MEDKPMKLPYPFRTLVVVKRKRGGIEKEEKKPSRNELAGCAGGVRGERLLDVIATPYKSTHTVCVNRAMVK